MMTRLLSKPYGFIYKTSLSDGRFYIGQHKIISHITLDPTYFGSGVIIKDYIKSVGTKSIVREILEFGFSHAEMNLLEAKHVTEEILSDPLNINLDKGGRHNYSRYKSVNNRISVSMAKKRKEYPELWPVRVGLSNNKSVNWKLISPTGEIFLFCGGLKKFCKSKGISGNTMSIAIIQGWIPKRGSCAGWTAFNLDNGTGTTRDTRNHGIAQSGSNNRWFKNKIEDEE